MMPGTVGTLTDFLYFVAQQSHAAMSLGYYSLATSGATFAAVLTLSLILVRRARRGAAALGTLRTVVYHARMLRESQRSYMDARDRWPEQDVRREQCGREVGRRTGALDAALRTADEVLKG